MFASLEEAAAARGKLTMFGPAMTADARAQRIGRWDRAVEAVLSVN